MTYNIGIRNAARESCLTAKAQKPVTISIRAKAGQRDLIDQAANHLGCSLKARAPWDTAAAAGKATGQRVK